MSAPLPIQHKRLLYTSSSLADAFSVSEAQVRAWVAQGRLPYRKGADGYRGLFFSQAEAERLVSDLLAEAEDAMRQRGAA